MSFITLPRPLPGFSGLSLVDQMSLLQSGWMEALLVGVAWRSQGAGGDELMFAGNLCLDEAQCRATGLADLYEALRHLIAKYRAMKLSPEEVVTLKAMALANSGKNKPLAPLPVTTVGQYCVSGQNRPVGGDVSLKFYRRNK